MLRLFLLFNFFLLNIYACQGGYNSCIQKIKDSQTICGKALYIPVKNNKLLVYSHHRPNAKILKYDPLLSLYLIEDKKKFPHPFMINNNLQLRSAMINNRIAKEGEILKNQVGLNSFAKYSKTLLIPAILSSSCCTLEGIVTSRGIIQKAYIQRFLSSKTVEYADIGIRVKNDGGYVIVTSSNPYLLHNPLKKEDCILSFDGVKIDAASVFMHKVLFSKIGSKHKIKVKRGSMTMSFRVVSKKRYGGGFVSDTFLEEKGIYFDHTLHIIKLSQHFLEYGLIIGDKLLQVNGVQVKSQAELLEYIENFKDFSSLLFERRKFQFFVNIK